MKLVFDDGIKEFEVNGGAILRFNPSDPALYDRFRGMIGKIEKLESDIAKESKETSDGNKALDKLCEYDHKVKGFLNEAFGLDNDFEQIFSGLNLMAVGTNGNRVVANFLDAIRPIIEDGAKQHAKAAAADAVAEANARRNAVK
ncbi:MAG: hypothetical protein IJZ15_04345 [Oscillospiraceae bacterium]|nr:hypothetical protein [Oscillospiraceae bacterium]